MFLLANNLKKICNEIIIYFRLMKDFRSVKKLITVCKSLFKILRIHPPILSKLVNIVLLV